jgi:hypothetical protein
MFERQKSPNNFLTSLYLINFTSFLGPKPAVIKSFTGTVYNINGEPACNQNRPTVLLPGYVKLIGGELHVPRKYDLIKSGVLKMTIHGNSFDDPLCLNGESQYMALPNSFW